MERPILFSTPMVQAILDGRKTQTRRIIKPQPKDHDHKDYYESDWKNAPPDYITDNGKEYYCRLCGEGICPDGHSLYKAKYQIGDILWVRETWRIVGWNDGDPFIIEFKDGKRKREVYLDESRAMDYAIECSGQCEAAGYKADEESGMFEFLVDTIPTKWRPSIFMPKEVCRIKLLVKDIRIEKLQEISEKDAIAEGIDRELNKGCLNIPYRAKYMMLWDSINGKEAHELNPWVWVIEFEKI